MLIDGVREKIERYLSERPQRSLRGLALRSNISYSTVRRIYNREVQEPNIERTIIPLLSVFLEFDEIFDLVAPYAPAWADLWGPNRKNDYKFSRFEEDPEWEDIDHIIVLESRREGGVTRAYIEHEYGRKIGGKRLDFLLRNGVLTERDGYIVPTVENVKSSNYKLVLQKIESGARNFDIDNIGRGSFFDYLSTRMSWQNFEEIRQLAKELVVLINEIDKSPSKGDDTLVTFGMFGDFLK